MVRNPLIARVLRHGPMSALRRFGQLVAHSGWRAASRLALTELFGGATLQGYDVDDYVYRENWRDEDVLLEIGNFAQQPLVSVVVPVYDVDREWLSACVESVRRQLYPNWELCLVDDGSTNPETRRFVDGLDALDDERIRVRRFEDNRGIVDATNAAIELATGDFIALLDHDDELTRDALFEVVRAINAEGADFVYSDEDKLETDGRKSSPHFKPDYCPDLLLAQNYICHLVVFRRSLLHGEAGFKPEMEGSQDHDLFLRLVERADVVFHIPKVLYHWRKAPGSTAQDVTAKPYAWEAGRRAVEAALQRRGGLGSVHRDSFPGTLRVSRTIVPEALVSILIPFRDGLPMLRRCVESIVERTTYQRYEILCLDNGSQPGGLEESLEGLRALDKRIRIIDLGFFPFNYSRLNNLGAEHSKGTHLCLLNSDTEVIAAGWLQALLGHSQREEVGAVGGRLYYPNDTIQHAGLILGLGGVAGCSHHGAARHAKGYHWRPHMIQNVSALTGACLMLSRTLYDEVGGLDEKNLPVAYNDVDLCLRLRERGLLNVYTPYCELYHAESATRGSDAAGSARERRAREEAYLRSRHRVALDAVDPYYSPNFSLTPPGFRLTESMRATRSSSGR
jgi:glycosyltransferase involved in cell wall biosynthesis